VGIATQDPELRAKFAGKPEHVINFFFLMAEEMRGYMAKLGMRSIEEMVGRSDLLRVDESTLTDKTRTLDLGPILTPAAALAPGERINGDVLAALQAEAQSGTRIAYCGDPMLETVLVVKE
jgi:hypothetical protein